MNVIEIIDRYRSNRPINIEGLIRELGVELDKKATLDANIAGQIERLSSGKYKISTNKNDHYYRQRFTMAHELGHFLLHQNLIGDGVNDDKLYRSTSEGNFYNTAIKKSHETQANKFAASVLMPLQIIKQDYEDTGHPDLSEFSKRWQVSTEALAIRLGLPRT